jgi:hypothetical protein
VGVAVLVVACLGWCAPAAQAATAKKPVVLVYGDSLVWESKKYINAGIDSKVWTRHVLAVPATAPCDWLQRLPGDVAKYHPVEITLATEGNSATPCMDDANGVLLAYDSPAYLAKYRVDLTAFFTDAGSTRVTFLEGAPLGCMTCASWNAAVSDVYGVAQDVASHFPNVIVSSAANLAVSNNGAYVQTMSCTAKEAKARKDGCTSGQIDVRTDTGIQAGVHLCPIGLNDYPTTHPCATFTNGKWVSVYSAGELRYGSAIAAATVAAL